MSQAIKHFTVEQIEAFIDGGDDGLVELLEAAVKEAKAASDGVATVQFFVDYEPEEEEEEDDPDARREQKMDDKRDFSNEPHGDD